MELICPNCKATISPDNVNISSDLAKCEKCNSIHKASELADNRLIDKLNNPPVGTKMTIKKGFDDSIEIFYPKKGFKPYMIFQIFFTLFWVGFTGFWIFLAVQENILIALIAIPFWLIGFSMIGGFINSLSETQTIKIAKTSLTIIKDRPIRPKKLELRIKDIQSIKMKQLKMNPFLMFGYFRLILKMQKQFGMGRIEVPAITSGLKTEYFFEEAYDAEQEWVTKTLNSIVKGMNY